ncbi:MAG: nicotinamide-nucleotide adenylyltransferase [Candidatus Micrarchaeota archaeon]|nr:nicotinamide-nucleotide adenylyltransferase [Candidatus Micrarchaeota archaeon]
MNGLLIGRFQPFHNGHLAAVMHGLKRCENLWIGIGSSNKSDERNPFSAEQRKEMIALSVGEDSMRRVQIFYIPDVSAHERWTYHVDAIIPGYDIVFSNDDFTLGLFRQRGINAIPVPYLSRETISGTAIRERICRGDEWQSLVPRGTRDVLNSVLLGPVKRV